MAIKTREQMLKKANFKIERVDFDDGDHTFVKQMNGRERDLFEKSLFRENMDAQGRVAGYERALEDYRAKLAVATTCDESGKLIFQPGDYETLSQNMTAYDLEGIVNASQRLNRITEKDRENLVKNSEGDQVADSTLDSAEN